MRNLLRQFVFITIPTLLLLFFILEIFFRIAIPACESPNWSWNDEFDFLYFENDPREGVHTIGKFGQQKGKWRINNFGWNSAIDYNLNKEKKRVVIIGDSYVESLQVDVEKSFHSILQKELAEAYEIYTVGTSGAPLSHYLHLSRYANEVFQPDILLFNLIHNDFDESIFEAYSEKKYFTLSLTEDGITEVLPENPNFTGLKYDFNRFIKKSALVRYLYYNLQVGRRPLFNFKEEEEANNNVAIDHIKKWSPQIEQVIDYVFSQIKKENPTKRIIFAIDGPRTDIYENRLNESTLIFLNKMVKGACDKYQYELIDFSIPMLEDYQLAQKKFNSDWDGHWNEYGHYFVSQHLLELFD